MWSCFRKRLKLATRGCLLYHRQVIHLLTGGLPDNQRIPPGGTPGWIRLSVRGGWQLRPAVSVTASIDDLQDEDYRVHGSGSNEPGFGGTVGVTLRF